VPIHKFITSGTLEEKIDALITEKQDTADAILTGGAGGVRSPQRRKDSTG
jgi:non-specific serine/threonine protein kinase